MNDVPNWVPVCLTVGGVVATATWVLRSELSKIRELLVAHVKDDIKEFAFVKARVTSLENYRKSRKR